METVKDERGEEVGGGKREGGGIKLGLGTPCQHDNESVQLKLTGYIGSGSTIDVSGQDVVYNALSGG